MTDKKQNPAPLQEWQRDAIAAEPRNFMRDVVNDARHVSQSASMIPDRQRMKEKPRARSGGTVPIQQYHGLRWCDALVNMQDALDRANAVRVRADLVEAAMNDKIKHRVETAYDPFSRSRMGFSDDDE